MELRAQRDNVAADVRGLEAEIDEIDATLHLDEWENANREHKIYQETLAGAKEYVQKCKGVDGWPQVMDFAKVGYSHAVEIGHYVHHREGDSVLKKLEGCRKALRTKVRRLIETDALITIRTGTVIDFEDRFDASYPGSAGAATTTVKGAELVISLDGSFGPRARHSQEAVDMMCFDTKKGLAFPAAFSKVTLKDDNGTFSCVPDMSVSEFIDILAIPSKVDESWFLGGDNPVPFAPGPKPELSDTDQKRKAELLAKAAPLRAELGEIEQELAATLEEYSDAQAAEVNLHLAIESRQQEWRDGQVRKGRAAAVAGVIVMAAGMTVLLGTAGARLGGSVGPDAVPIGIGVSVPLILIGVATLTGGVVHQKRANK